MLLEASALWRLALLVSPCVLFGLDALTVVLDPERARLLAGGSYDLTNRGAHKLRVLPLKCPLSVSVMCLASRTVAS